MARTTFDGKEFPEKLVCTEASALNLARLIHLLLRMRGGNGFTRVSVPIAAPTGRPEIAQRWGGTGTSPHSLRATAEKFGL